jgi:hypothetical protein
MRVIAGTAYGGIPADVGSGTRDLEILDGEERK